MYYVNKQECSASSWRSNQGYTKMHGQPTIKIHKPVAQLYIYHFARNIVYHGGHEIVSQDIKCAHSVTIATESWYKPPR